MPPKAKAKSVRSSASANVPRVSGANVLRVSVRSRGKGVGKSFTKGPYSNGENVDEGAHLLGEPDHKEPPLLADARVSQNQFDTDPKAVANISEQESSLQTGRKPKKKAHGKISVVRKSTQAPHLDEAKSHEIVDVRGSLFNGPTEDDRETTTASTSPYPRKVVVKKKVVRKVKPQGGEPAQSEPVARVSQQDEKSSTSSNFRSPTKAATLRAHPKPFLAGLSPAPSPEISEGEGSDGIQCAEGKLKTNPKRLSMRRASAASSVRNRTELLDTCEEEQPGSQPAAIQQEETERRVPLASLTFRFLNYNMANRTDATLDDVASGFQELHRARTQANGTARSLQPCSSEEACLTETETPTAETPMTTTMTQKLPVEHRNLAQLLLEGAKFESIFPQEQALDQVKDAQRRPRISTEFDALEDIENSATLQSPLPNLGKQKARKDRNSTIRRSVQKRNSQQAETKPPKLLTFADAGEDEPNEKGNNDTAGGQKAAPKMIPSSSMKSMASTSTTKSSKPAAKKTKSFFRSFTLRKAKTKQGTFVHRSMNVDCIFGTLCESQFPLDEMAEVLNDELTNGDCHTLSAQTMVNEKGTIEGMRGLVAGALCGDLKTVTMIRNSTSTENGSARFEEAGKTITPCEDKGNNPMKSFLIRAFDVEYGGSADSSKPAKSRTLRLLLLGSHFPMKKVAGLMQDAESPDENVIQQTKYMMARLLKKSLHHLLEEKLLTKNSIVLLQGDLNSRCILHDGNFLDIIWETLRDNNLQQYISMGLPTELRGDWREVVQCENSGDLPVTYRFDHKQPPSVARGTNLQLREVYGECDGSAKSYRNIMEKIQDSGIQKDWGLYNQKLDDDGTKFKASRLPSCTERVLYYAPASLGDTCWWTSSQGYEVNYLQVGSDHKPVVLEATLNIGRRHDSLRAMSVVPGLSCLPDDIESAIGHLSLEAEGSGNTSDSDAPEVAPRKRTAMRLSVEEDLSLE